MPVHNTLTGSELHEPKGIDSAGTTDAGKVLTPSSTNAGQGELRNLTESEITGKTAYIVTHFNNINTTTDIFIPTNVAGTIDSIRSVIDAAFTGADTTLTCKINGTNITGGALVITQVGSAAGDVDSASPTANKTLAVGDYIQVTSDTAATSGVNATLMFTITRA